MTELGSLASLISSVKANTATNSMLQKSLAGKRKRIASEEKELLAKKKKKNAEIAALAAKVSGPTVVVFDGSSLRKKATGESKAEKRAFMSSKISKPEPSLSAIPKPLSEKDQEEEEENDRHDKDLKELLATTKLLEEYQLEEMSGKERRKHMMAKMEALGVKASANGKVPLAMHLGMEAKKSERQQQKLQNAKDLGLYDKSTRHLYVDKKEKERSKDTGITNGIGKMKGAMLTISKNELKRVSRQGVKKAKGPKQTKKRK
ncbi:hypothetical protein J3Q64DRAFT_1715360 [Phycomyces blakesleeanus]|uniref:Uncharacterized protein n=1 Tax=Phycomyces blakesleeanus TaxID=4837 RepID=A0ABR3BG30_PHYBL